MTYLAIARKYRPQTFDQFIAQEPIVRTLKNAIEQSRVAHAYIFSGMRGVGKTTAARILAKALNCEKGPTVTPCGACPSCVEIASSTSMDVLEVDAASTGRVEEVRVLLENARYVPARDRYKVFIIDEAHMLTKEACNALLKTLEEPPPRVVFVLATTEPHKIISTIHSRCQSFYFRSVSFEEILSVLARVAGDEKIKADSEALAVMARAAEGSLRDALSILDQAIAYCGGQINADKVRELLGVVSEDVLERLVEAVRAQSAEAVLQLVDELVRDGHNLQHFSREVLRHIRNLLLVRVGGPAAALVEATGAERAHLEAVARVFSEEDLLRFFNALLRTDGELRWSPHPRLHLELALLKLVQAERLASVEEVLAELTGQAPAPRPTTATAASPPPVAQKSAGALHPPKLEERRRAPAATASNLEPATIDSIKSAVYGRSKFLGSFVENVAAWERDKETLNLWFAPENRSLSEMLGRKQLGELETMVSEVLGEPVKISPRVAAGTAAPAAATQSRPAADARAQNPVVQALLERFGGTLRTASELPRRKGQD